MNALPCSSGFHHGHRNPISRSSSGCKYLVDMITGYISSPWCKLAFMMFCKIIFVYCSTLNIQIRFCANLCMYTTFTWIIKKSWIREFLSYMVSKLWFFFFLVGKRYDVKHEFTVEDYFLWNLALTHIMPLSIKIKLSLLMVFSFPFIPSPCPLEWRWWSSTTDGCFLHSKYIANNIIYAVSCHEFWRLLQINTLSNSELNPSYYRRSNWIFVKLLIS